MAPPVSETGPRTSATSGGTDEAMSAVLAKNWWVLALRGVLGILFGLIAFVYPGATMLSLVLNPVYFEKRSFSSSGSRVSLTQRRSAMTKGSRFRRAS